jgi:hypothetical protein
MLGLAAAAPPRRVPLPELGIAAGLWLFVAGVAADHDALLAVGVAVMALGLSAPGLLFLRVAVAGRTGWREGPVAHVAVGLVFVLQAAALALAAAGEVVAERRAAVAGVLLLGLGWAAGVIAGHLGKLISLSGWGSWPPGPRPRQEALYPRRGWQVEVLVFAVGVETLALGILGGWEAVARFGAALLVAAALLALGAALETLRRVAAARP